MPFRYHRNLGLAGNKISLLPKSVHGSECSLASCAEERGARGCVLRGSEFICCLTSCLLVTFPGFHVSCWTNHLIFGPMRNQLKQVKKKQSQSEIKKSWRESCWQAKQAEAKAFCSTCVCHLLHGSGWPWLAQN